MRASTRFAIAVHILMLTAAFQDKYKITSSMLSDSTGVNAVIIRNIFSKLKKAKIIQVSPGTSGIKLIKKPEQISLFDIYATVEIEEPINVLSIHQNIPCDCPIGISVTDILMKHFITAATAMENELSKVSLLDLLNEIKETVPDLQPPWLHGKLD
ncbi:transcriptional regulator, BadM/Rrf2 family [Syntrophobotulus glycolicus DSM 8271]|uniref:Transcriptional regulator, BadM/Rrf2 family n=1 Tax=Syntrophobotulus glycolicus (strain DSM 8271 / FlGlyR) TaxID=645991 RepID=F0SV68_SYNGF|nr:Rrf2 family transcriptional regulator [Syntrophobotulus glycolicus]ADY55568.1 transcriptional regulator, BadM/Rrf2 family [Syntrophobotulus glycolicus DSM 8271]